MSYDEFLRQLGKAGLSVREFAGLLRMNPNSVSNYAHTSEVPDHLAVIAALMGEMGEHRLDFRTVLSRIELRSKKPRGGAGPGRFGGDRQQDLDLLS
jgi:transcriptional regulator with XRE-family HTH domain